MENDRRQFDLAVGPLAQSAQFNLITIVLGIVLGALLARLTTLRFIGDQPLHVVLTIVLALATLIASVDLWIKYTWGLLLFEWPFEAGHNLIYFFIGATQTAMAVTINSIQLWLWPASLLCIGAIIAYVHNANLSDKSPVGQAFRAGLNKPVNPPEPKPWLWDRSYLIPSNDFELGVTIMYALLMIGGAIVLNYGNTQLPYARLVYLHQPILAFCWGGFGLICSIIDIMIQTQIMKNQRELYIRIRIAQAERAPVEEHVR